MDAQNFTWIPVGTTIPEDLIDVLLFDEKDGQWIGYYFRDTGHFIRAVDGAILKNISHWMPLPANPR
ncbi:DUF551 domain-containing protein [Desertivirga brevis]|uniref:DUF551 domain-containing protein n=1 Tax=Desertivirga brevis TaxID=2810310 RepID=UPI001A95FC3F|nr:DUF551 domain-containing protein [Pedobacter sp. SYSU D00873]